MIAEINKLKKGNETFALELTSGKIIQIYDGNSVATHEFIGPPGGPRRGVVGILRSTGVFDLIDAAHIVSVSAGIHAVEKERMENRLKPFKKIVEGEQT